MFFCSFRRHPVRAERMALETESPLIEFFISAHELPRTLLSHADAFAVVSLKQSESGVYQRLGMTDVIDNSASPEWSQQFLVKYDFHAIQYLKIEVYQKTQSPREDFANQEFLGSTQFPVSSLIKSPEKSISRQLEYVKQSGRIVVRGGAVEEIHDILHIQFSARHLPRVSGYFSTCDPFITISRIIEGSETQRVWKNSPLKSNDHPSWPINSISLQLLCKGELDLPLRIALFDWNSNGEHELFGSYDTTIRVLTSQSEIEVPLKKETSSQGSLVIRQISLERHPTFLQYLRGGCQISVAVGIDFTSGNGEPSDPSSLHFWDSSHTSLNHYQQAIQAVGSVLEQYDTDKLYPVCGFGAKVKSLSTGEFSPTQHWFSLSETGEEVRGINGILDLYEKAIKRLQFHQPLLIRPLVDYTIQRSIGSCTQNNQKYTVLLLLTCGGISDFEATIDSLVRAAEVAPLSVIIIGLGSSNFEEMRILDADVNALQSGNTIAARDLVQFVRFNDFAHKSPEELAKKVLEEIPGQLLSYMIQHNILPQEMPH